MGNSIIPGSTNPAHIADNAAIFDFVLTDEEMDRIAKLDGTKRYYEPSREKLDSYAAAKLDYDSQK